jgi:hypothetical protein
MSGKCETKCNGSVSIDATQYSKNTQQRQDHVRKSDGQSIVLYFRDVEILEAFRFLAVAVSVTGFLFSIIL